MRSVSASKLILALLLAVFLGRIVSTYRVFNDTFDEAGHIRNGLEVLQRHSFTIQSEHPPFGEVILAALPYYLGDLILEPGNELWGTGPWAHEDAAYYWRTLTLARAGNLVFAAVLFVFVCLWSTRLFGKLAGLAAGLVIACCPNLIGHGGLATLDMAAAATVTATAYSFWRWSEEPVHWRGALAALAFGVAVITKISALFFLPPLAVLYFLAANKKPALKTVAAGCLIVFLVVWAGYLFEVGAIVPPGHGYWSTFGGPRPGSIPRWILDVAGHHRIPAQRFVQGIVEVFNHNDAGHRAYLLGKFEQRGWWWYFPVAIELKSTIPLVLLAAVGIFAAGRGAISAFLPAVLVPVIAMSSNLNIGIRHVLPMYPFLAILGSGVFRPGRSKDLKVLGLLLLAWHAGESALAHPDYLAYFNQIARGQEQKFLADSNLDWGQDLARLGEFVREKNIDSIYLSYFGMSNPEKFGIPAKPLPPGTLVDGWVAISANNLLGVANDPGDFAWLKDRTPSARVGKSIFVYYYSRSTER